MSDERVPANADALGGMISSGTVIPKPDKTEVESALARSDDDRTLGDWNAIEEAARWALWTLPDGANFADLAGRHPLWLRLTGTKVMGGLPSPSAAGVDRYINAITKPDACADEKK